MALSDLGDWETACDNNFLCSQHCNRISEPIFNYGLMISGLMIAFASLGLYRYSESKASPILLALSSISLSLIGLLPERYGVLHFMVALLFFLLLPIAMLLHAKWTWHEHRIESLITIALSVVSFSGILLFISIKVLDLDLGYAIPEIIGALPASVWLGVLFYKYLIENNKTN